MHIKKGLRITANSEQFPGTRNTKIIFFGEVKVDDDSLLEVVQSILRSNGFAIVQSDVKEMLQVVPLGEVRPFAPLLVDNEVGENDPGAYVTGVFPLQHAKEQDVLEYLNKFFYLGKPDQTANNISSISGRNTLVITETVKRLVRIKALIEKLDVPATKQLREFYKVQHLQAEELKQQLNEILGLAASKPITGQTAAQMGILKIDAILRTNQLLLTGSRASIVIPLNSSSNSMSKTN